MSIGTEVPGVAALYCVYHDDIWLPFSYRSIYPVVERIYFFVSERPWNGPKTDNAETIECINNLADPDRKVQLIRDDWGDQVAQRNFSLAQAIVDGFQYGMIVDADEIYESEQLWEMLRYAVSRPEVDCWHAKWLTYWKSPQFRIDPIEPYDPPVLVKLGSCGFVETRNPQGEKHELIPPSLGLCHHMSYARPDELIQRKIASISAAPQIRPEWYEEVWKAWDTNHELTDLHPVNPPFYKRAVPQPAQSLPAVLRESELPL